MGKRILLVVALLVGFGTAAQAQRGNFEGFYGGIGALYVWQHTSAQGYTMAGAPLLLTKQDRDYPGVVLRGAYQYHLSPKIVAGVALSATFVNTEGSVPIGAVVNQYNDGWVYGARLKLGYVISDRVLIHSSGGLNWTRTTFSRVTPLVTDTITTDRLAPTIGIGFDYVLSDRWSITTDFRYVHYLEKRLNFPNAGIYALSTSDNAVATIILNYKFGSIF